MISLLKRNSGIPPRHSERLPLRHSEQSEESCPDYAIPPLFVVALRSFAALWMTVGALWMTLVLALSSTSAMASESKKSKENVIVVKGQRRERTEHRRSGHSVSVKPEEASRFETLTHLKRESSVLAQETGRISPSGFVVPKVHGQDVRQTDVYLEDTLLQDPYSGLPLVEDIDLRAFGVLEIHQGVPPADVPGLNPIATLRYKVRPASKSSVTAGSQAGQPFGLSAWSLANHSGKPDARLGKTDARLYVRHHQTSGRYAYYSDEGTPYNVNDDRFRSRENNDQRSLQAVPFFRHRFGPYRIQGLGWAHQAQRGLPSLSAVVPSSAREKAAGHLGSLLLTRDLTLGSKALTTLGLGFTSTLDQRSLEDPGRRFLGSAEQSTMQVKSRRFSLSAKVMTEPLSLFLGLESGKAAAKNSLGEKTTEGLERRSDLASLGVRASPHHLWLIEAKVAGRSHSDQKKNANNSLASLEDETALTQRHTSSLAYGSSVALGQDDLGLYVQTAYATRLPSLIEEFGNGSSIRPNAELSNEGLWHKEIGAFIKRPFLAWRLGVAGYEDLTTNKIILVPVMANAVKAMNVRKTKVQGVDLRSEAGFKGTTLYATFSRLFPYDETRPERKKNLPGIPERIWVIDAEQNISSFTLRWMARYRSEVFRDLANSIELPGAWIHDFSIDDRVSVASKNDLRAGLSVKNVFNLTDVTIRAPETKHSWGRTAYSDVAGAPLPGRQWLFSLTFTI